MLHGSKDMSGDGKKEVDFNVAGDDTEQLKKKKTKKGVFSGIFGIFRLHGDDFEKRLKCISKEEAIILSRIKKRSHTWRGTTKNLIQLSIMLEVVAVGLAIMTTRSLNLSWQMRSTRVLPMFLLPVLAFLIYSALGRLTRMCDRMDENTLEELREERKVKIDELKEKTNYYRTQQLIQRYDTDPAAKALAASVLAASVLAAKLGADSGMKVFMSEESTLGASIGNSNDAETVQPGGLRNRKQSQTRADIVDGTLIDHDGSYMLQTMELERHGQQQMIADQFQPIESSPHNPHDVSWISRLAALLVGEDPTQSYALICGNCHMHNGLARKEDFPYIIYYCPHCKALNRTNPEDELIPSSDNLVPIPSSVVGVDGSLADIDKGMMVDTVLTGSNVVAVVEGTTSLSLTTAASSSVADVDKDNKGLVVDTTTTGSPMAAAAEYQK